MRPSHAVVRTAHAHNADVLGVVDGYEGLLNGEFRHLGVRDVSGILQRAEPFCKPAAVHDLKEAKGQREAIRRMNEAG